MLLDGVADLGSGGISFGTKVAKDYERLGGGGILLPRLAFHLSRNAKELNGVRKFSSSGTIS
jgi:hypothetical protein